VRPTELRRLRREHHRRPRPDNPAAQGHHGAAPGPEPSLGVSSLDLGRCAVMCSGPFHRCRLSRRSFSQGDLPSSASVRTQGYRRVLIKIGLVVAVQALLHQSGDRDRRAHQRCLQAALVAQLHMCTEYRGGVKRFV
jgi:hypothetical protein